MRPIKYSYPPKFEYESEPSIWQNPKETELLISFLSSIKGDSHLNFLEIGIGHGQFGYLLSEHFDISITGIDRKNPFKDEPSQSPYYKIIVSDSKKDRAIMEASYQAPYDVIFIGGGHSAASVTSDYNNYKDMAESVIVFHNISGNREGRYPTSLGVKRFWTAIKKDYLTLEIKDQFPYTCGLGILFKERVHEQSGVCD